MSSQKQKRKKSTYKVQCFLLKKQNYLCALCFQPIDFYEGIYDVDHIKPLCEGGSNSITNLQIIHPNCHRRKSLKEIEERTCARKLKSKKHEIILENNNNEEFINFCEKCIYPFK